MIVLIARSRSSRRGNGADRGLRFPKESASSRRRLRRGISFLNGLLVYCLIWLALLVGSLECFTQGDLPWQWRNPLPQGNDLSDVTYGNGTFIAVGQGVALSSTSGTNWTVTPLPIYNVNQHIAYGNGIFVVQADTFETRQAVSLLTSTNGQEWVEVHFDKDYLLYDITFGNGQFVAIGTRVGVSAGVALVSADGQSWSEHPTGCDIQ